MLNKIFALALIVLLPYTSNSEDSLKTCNEKSRAKCIGTYPAVLAQDVQLSLEHFPALSKTFLVVHTPNPQNITHLIIDIDGEMNPYSPKPRDYLLEKGNLGYGVNARKFEVRRGVIEAIVNSVETFFIFHKNRGQRISYSYKEHCGKPARKINGQKYYHVCHAFENFITRRN